MIASFCRASILLVVALCAACAPVGRNPPPLAVSAPAEPPITILISIDGMRPAALQRGDTPQLDALAATGVSGSMRPVFPTITFPNHISLVTGLYPDQHGIVANTMRDPALPGSTFATGDPKTNRDPAWWNSTEPIWVTAENAGMRTATMFWPGADAAIRGVRPRNWWTYDGAVSTVQRVEMVLDWARRPAASRPRLILLYFAAVDQRAHNDGFDSPQERAAMRDVDAGIGMLVEGLAELGRSANLVIVSDHGMAPAPPAQQRPITEVVDPALMDAITEGTLLSIWPKLGMEAATAAHFSKARQGISCLPKEKLPERHHFGKNPRVSPWLCMAETGWSFLSNPHPFVKGEHGYDPDSEAMAALFIAHGPSFRQRMTQPRFDLVHVYPLLAHLIGLQPQPNEGDIRALDPILRAP